MSTSQGVWLIRGARPLGGGPADIVIRDGVIDSIGDGPAPPGAQVLDAAGLGMLVAAHRRAGRSGRRLVLRSVPPPVGRVLAMTRLHRVLNVERAPDFADA